MKKPPKLRAEFLRKLQDIKEKAVNNDISMYDIETVLYFKLGIRPQHRSKQRVIKKVSDSSSSCGQWLLCAAVPCLLAILLWYINAGYSVAEMWGDVFHSRCMMERNAIIQEMTRPVVDCSMCRGLGAVREVENITQEDFITNHAYTGVPLLVRGATRHWAALHTFNYSFFKDIYLNTEGALESVEDECQYFAYKTDFVTLRQVFEMPESRAAFAKNETPWYVGWSNCDPVVSVELRKHYERPYFLPNQTEASVLDWIFMGGFGPGAMIHIDYVQRPSWQAQISGSKRWTLIPPPECEDQCSTLHVHVHKGDIVCINTNEWYHDTYIEEGEISITIGSEYD